jgi:hypothetical protein
MKPDRAETLKEFAIRGILMMVSITTSLLVIAGIKSLLSQP